MNKRQKPDSRDEKSPAPHKKRQPKPSQPKDQPSLNKFLNIKTESQMKNHKEQKQSVIQDSFCYQDVYKKCQIPIDQEKNQQFEKYLDPDFLYICMKCNKNIESCTKLIINNVIYCVVCGCQNLKDGMQYTVLKPFQKSSLIEVQMRKSLIISKNSKKSNNVKINDELEQLQNSESQDQQFYKLWSFKQDLQLMNAIEKCGIHSFRAIKDQMKTQRDVLDIELHIHQLNRLMIQSQRKIERENNLQISHESRSSGKSIKFIYQKERNRNNAIIKNMESPSEGQQIEKENQVADRRKKYNANSNSLKDRRLKALGYNSKREQFEIRIPSMYEYLLAQYDSQQDQNEEVKQILLKNYQREKKTQAMVDRRLVQSQVLVKNMKNNQQSIDKIQMKQSKRMKPEINFIQQDQQFNNLNKHNEYQHFDQDKYQEQDEDQLELNQMMLYFMQCQLQEEKRTQILFNDLKAVQQLVQLEEQKQKRYQELIRFNQINNKATTTIPQALQDSIYNMQDVNNLVEFRKNKEKQIIAKYQKKQQEMRQQMKEQKKKESKKKESKKKV